MFINMTILLCVVTNAIIKYTEAVKVSSSASSGFHLTGDKRFLNPILNAK